MINWAIPLCKWSRSTNWKTSSKCEWLHEQEHGKTNNSVFWNV